MTEAGLVLTLRVTPNAGRDSIEGVELRADGSAVMRMRVRAVPDKGKANAAVIALLGKALGVPNEPSASSAAEDGADRRRSGGAGRAAGIDLLSTAPSPPGAASPNAPENRGKCIASRASIWHKHCHNPRGGKGPVCAASRPDQRALSGGTRIRGKFQ